MIALAVAPSLAALPRIRMAIVVGVPVMMMPTRLVGAVASSPPQRLLPTQPRSPPHTHLSHALTPFVSGRPGGSLGCVKAQRLS